MTDRVLSYAVSLVRSKKRRQALRREIRRGKGSHRRWSDAARAARFRDELLGAVWVAVNELEFRGG